MMYKTLPFLVVAGAQTAEIVADVADAPADCGQQTEQPLGYDPLTQDLADGVEAQGVCAKHYQGAPRMLVCENGVLKEKVEQSERLLEDGRVDTTVEAPEAGCQPKKNLICMHHGRDPETWKAWNSREGWIIKEYKVKKNQPDRPDNWWTEQRRLQCDQRKSYAPGSFYLKDTAGSCQSECYMLCGSRTEKGYVMQQSVEEGAGVTTQATCQKGYRKVAVSEAGDDQARLLQDGTITLECTETHPGTSLTEATWMLSHASAFKCEKEDDTTVYDIKRQHIDGNMRKTGEYTLNYETMEMFVTCEPGHVLDPAVKSSARLIKKKGEEVVQIGGKDFMNIQDLCRKGCSILNHVDCDSYQKDWGRNIGFPFSRLYDLWANLADEQCHHGYRMKSVHEFEGRVKDSEALTSQLRRGFSVRPALEYTMVKNGLAVTTDEKSITTHDRVHFDRDQVTLDEDNDVIDAVAGYATSVCAKQCVIEIVHKMELGSELTCNDGYKLHKKGANETFVPFEADEAVVCDDEFDAMAWSCKDVSECEESKVAGSGKCQEGEMLKLSNKTLDGEGKCIEGEWIEPECVPIPEDVIYNEKALKEFGMMFHGVNVDSFKEGENVDIATTMTCDTGFQLTNDANAQNAYVEKDGSNVWVPVNICQPIQCTVDGNIFAFDHPITCVKGKKLSVPNAKCKANLTAVCDEIKCQNANTLETAYGMPLKCKDKYKSNENCSTGNEICVKEDTCKHNNEDLVVGTNIQCGTDQELQELDGRKSSLTVCTKGKQTKCVTARCTVVGTQFEKLEWSVKVAVRCADGYQLEDPKKTSCKDAKCVKSKTTNKTTEKPTTVDKKTKKGNGAYVAMCTALAAILML